VLLAIVVEIGVTAPAAPLYKRRPWDYVIGQCSKLLVDIEQNLQMSIVAFNNLKVLLSLGRFRYITVYPKHQ
jgi:hypothetical protein